MHRDKVSQFSRRSVFGESLERQSAPGVALVIQSQSISSRTSLDKTSLWDMTTLKMFIYIGRGRYVSWTFASVVVVRVTRGR